MESKKVTKVLMNNVIEDYTIAVLNYRAAYGWMNSVCDEGLDIFNVNMGKATKQLNEKYDNYIRAKINLENLINVFKEGEENENN